MQIIEIAVLENGAHRNQSWNCTVPPEGYAIVPDGLELPNFPFGEAAVEKIDGIMTVTAWTPVEMPEPEPEQEPVAPLSDFEIANAILNGINEI